MTLPAKTFGPVVYHEPDGSFRASCRWCVFYASYYSDGGRGRCSHVTPLGRVPDPDNTPDWCEMKADMLRDAKDAVGA